MFDCLGRITELREARGWSPYKLAKETGIPQSTFMTWYAQNRYPSLEKLEVICEALSVTLPEFFSDEEQLEKRSATKDLTELDSKFILLNDNQRAAVLSVIEAFLQD